MDYHLKSKTVIKYMTKICAISDTHNLHKQFVGSMEIPECDILIHAGDATSRGTENECLNFIGWFINQHQAKHKIYVPGNHDYDTQKYDDVYVKIMGDYPNTHFLVDREIVCEGLKIYGTPWTPFFCDWAWNGLEEREEQGMDYEGGPGNGCNPDNEHPLLLEVYSKIPEDTNILVCHGPPRLSFLDRTLEGNEVGSRELRDRCLYLGNLKVGICGHIHEGRGDAYFNGATWYNVSSCNRSYHLVNPPVVIEV